ncbi:MAG TPA: fasciclin domain-containing protein [Puia sp.]|nr:fasciclin domain-containing protein [Puia sp.]
MMKINARLYFSFFITCFLFSISCNKQETNNINPQTSSLTHVLANGTNTTIFYSAVVKGGLDSVFAGPSIFTLFVPTDQACNVSGFTQSVINGFSYDQARQWVLYQTYAGTALTFESFIGKTEEKLIMANGDSVFVTGDSNRTYVNGFQFVNSEAAGNNGTMLALQNVLVPPAMNLAQILNTDTSLTFFNQAVSLATPVPDTLSKTLAAGGPFTLLAPNNDAFRILGYNSPGDISSISPDSLRNLVLTSLIPQRLFSYDVVDSSTFVTVNDSTLIFNLTGLQTTVKVVGSPYSSNFVSYNTMAINGVLFKTDSLLIRYTH